MSKLNDIIFEQKKSSSEELLEIAIPSEHQCKYIDNILRDVANAQKELDRALKEDDTDEKDEYISSAVSSLYSIDYDLEDIRTAIDQVRTWGQEWKDLAKQLLEEKENLREYLGFEEVK